MAKFEANIPSYLKSGAGSVPIDDTFQKIGSQPENLSAVIDNYSRNFSGGIQYPDGVPMGDAPVDTQLGPKQFPRVEGEFKPTMPTLNLEEIIKPDMSEASVKPMEPEIPTDSEIKDILIA